MARYFGTDGFRGEANINLTADHAYKVGRFLGWYYTEKRARAAEEGRPAKEGPARIVIGKDTRRSSYMFEYSLVAGLTASGADAYLLHVTTTPSVAYIARVDDFDCGIMISASHNPYYDNGIKVINERGEKLEESVIEEIEKYLDGETEEIPFATKDDIGKTVDFAAGRNRYIGYLISIATRSFKNKKVALDCANGSASAIAKSVFDALGAETHVINNEPNGLNINTNCGSTHIDGLAAMVKAGSYDLGLAFDGDADRFLAVSETGVPIDGDQIMAACGRALKEQGRLPGNTIVATVMSNLGLHVFAKEHGLKLEITDVGDRNVLERMLEQGYVLGGEQSGHMIFTDYATTGDGQLTALQVLSLLKESGKKASELFGACARYPQVLINVPVADNDVKKAVMASQALWDAVKAEEEQLAGSGRILVRPSGTEALMRVMVEAKTEDVARQTAQRLAQMIPSLAKE